MISYKAVDNIFAIQDILPENVNPIKVAEMFVRTIDLEKTKVLRAAINGNKYTNETPQNDNTYYNTKGNRTTHKRGPYKKGDVGETDEPIDVVLRVAIYKERIIDIWRRLGEDLFTGSDIKKYLLDYYGVRIRETTAYNKQRGYVEYMKKNGFIKEVNSFNKAKVYKFISAPFGAEPAAKAEFDPEDAQKRKLIELSTMRDGMRV
jgi:hypothetical protein